MSLKRNLFTKIFTHLQRGAFQMCKNLDTPHSLTPSPKNGRRGTRIMSPLSYMKGEGLGVREKI
jgi:hypothetical protein